MPQIPKDLEATVQRMIDAGESPENIHAVMGEYHKHAPEGIVPASQADTFGGGFADSVMNGEALKAGLKGGWGFLKGAIGDLPSSFGGALSNIGDAISDPAKFGHQTMDVMSNLPSDLMSAGKQGAKGFMDTASRAGSEPEAFGEMMGQITGQPAVTAGLFKGVPAGTFGSESAIPSGVEMMGRTKPFIGRGLEAIGAEMRDNQPLSGFTPRFADVRTLRRIEAGVGSRINKIGRNMRPMINGEVVEPELADGNIVRKIPRKELPPSDTHYVKPRYKFTNDSHRLNSPTEMEPGNIPGTKAKPKVSSGPFEGQPSKMPNTRSGNTRVKPVDEAFIKAQQNMKPGPLKTLAEEYIKKDLKLDSRVSGLPPEEAAPKMGPVSKLPISKVNLFDQMRAEAQRYGLPLEDYIQSLRETGGEDFVMPSAEMPRVR